MPQIRGETLALSARARFFQDTPTSQRRLGLLIFALISPLFVATFAAHGGKSHRGALLAFGALLAAEILVLALRRTPRLWDWFIPVAVAPNVSCAVAAAALGAPGEVYVGLSGVCVACAAALFPWPVAALAWACASASFAVVWGAQMPARAAVGSALLFSTAMGVATWILALRANGLRQARADLARELGRSRTLVAALAEGVVEVDADGMVVMANPAAKQILGLGLAELSGWSAAEPPWEAFREGGLPFPVQDRPVSYTLRTGQPCSEVPMGLKLPNGSLVWLSVSSRPLLSPPEATPSGVVMTFRDVTRERAAAEALARSAERLRLSLAAALQVEWELDVAKGVIAASPWDADGPADAIEETFEAWKRGIHADDLRRTLSLLDDCLEGRSPRYEAEYRLRRTGGGYRWVRSRGQVSERDASGRPRRMLGTRMDVTEVHALQEQLLSASRFASVGSLAAGVAHEINNPLAWLTSNLGYALDQLRADGREPPAGDLRELLDEALQGARRIRDIVKAMRSMGRPESTAPPATVDVGAELHSALQMVENQLAQRARLEVDIPEGLPLARARTRELSRAFLNLLLNAAQAIPEGRSSLHLIAVTARLARGEISVAISDTGVGLSPATRERIFDPFFTTRPVGEGLGLGLTLARSVVEGAGGRIEVESEEGCGSTFRVVLPAAEPVAGSASAGAPRAAEAPAGLRVLLVDDEPLIARSFSRILRDKYSVTAVSQVSEALRHIDAGEHFDAVLCDVMMPDVDGIELYRALAARHPALLRRFAFMTGGAFDERSAAFLASHDVLVLAKPIERDALERALDQLAGAETDGKA